VQIKFTADTFLCYQPFALFPIELADNSLRYMTLLWTSGNKYSINLPHATERSQHCVAIR
jgi:hypothetical protein